VVSALAVDRPQLRRCLLLVILGIRALLALSLSVIGSCLADHARVHLVVANDVLLYL